MNYVLAGIGVLALGGLSYWIYKNARKEYNEILSGEVLEDEVANRLKEIKELANIEENVFDDEEVDQLDETPVEVAEIKDSYAEEFPGHELLSNYDKNSDAAFAVYQKFMMDKVSDSVVRYKLETLWTRNWKPVKADMSTFEKIRHGRLKFFGYESKWCEKVTIAELIIFFAEMIAEDLKKSVSWGVQYLLEGCMMFPPPPTQNALNFAVQKLANHEVTTERWMTMFKLPIGSFEHAEINAMSFMGQYSEWRAQNL